MIHAYEKVVHVERVYRSTDRICIMTAYYINVSGRTENYLLVQLNQPVKGFENSSNVRTTLQIQTACRMQMQFLRHRGIYARETSAKLP
jgi:intergrase/recombinase